MSTEHLPDRGKFPHAAGYRKQPAAAKPKRGARKIIRLLSHMVRGRWPHGQRYGIRRNRPRHRVTAHTACDPGASVRRRHGGRDAGAEIRSQPLSLERPQGAHSVGDTPHPFVLASASAYFSLGAEERELFRGYEAEFGERLPLITQCAAPALPQAGGGAAPVVKMAYLLIFLRRLGAAKRLSSVSNGTLAKSPACSP